MTDTPTTAKRLYEQLTADRQRSLDVARRASELTIPSLLPPDGATNSTTLPSPYQSIGAYGVNNLAAKLLLALYPPGNAFFRYLLPEAISEEAQALSKEMREEMEKKLASTENRAMQRFETSSIRPKKAEEFLHLVVAGNVLTYFEDLKTYRLYRLDQYVVTRDASGRPLETVVFERVNPRAIDEATKEACGILDNQKQDVEVYTHVIWNWVDGTCEWSQEINGKTVPDSEGHAPVDLSPWNPLRWKAVPGSDYGRGHCEEYLGDLISLEGLSQSVVDFAAIASKILFLVHPGSTTDVGEMNRAQSGDAVAGRKDDVDVLQLDKYADFQVIEKVIARIEERLSRAFLLRSGLVRDAERVTAEEIRGTAQELEDTLGGTYTVLADEEQMPFIRRLLHVLTTSGEIPAFPRGTVEPVVVTGFQALGRNHSLNKLRGALGDLNAIFGPEGVLRILEPTGIATDVLLGWGVENAATKVKSKEQLAQEDADAQRAAIMQELISKGTAPAVSGLMKDN